MLKLFLYMYLYCYTFYTINCISLFKKILLYFIKEISNTNSAAGSGGGGLC